MSCQLQHISQSLALGISARLLTVRHPGLTVTSVIIKIKRITSEESFSQQPLLWPVYFWEVSKQAFVFTIIGQMHFWNRSVGVLGVIWLLEVAKVVYGRASAVLLKWVCARSCPRVHAHALRGTWRARSNFPFHPTAHARCKRLWERSARRSDKSTGEG